MFIENGGIDDWNIIEECAQSCPIVYSKKYNLTIDIRPDYNNINNSYFRIFNNSDQFKATKLARISMTKPEYKYNTDFGKVVQLKDWFLNKNEKKNLLKILNTIGNKDKEIYCIFHTGIKIWESLILKYNNELDLNENETKLNLLPNKKYINYLPYNLSIPDYTKLN